MNGKIPDQDAATARRIVLEKWANGIDRLIQEVIEPVDHIEFLGYLLMAAIPRRAARDGVSQTIRALKLFVPEACATGLDVASAKPGHGVDLVVHSPLAGKI